MNVYIELTYCLERKKAVKAIFFSEKAKVSWEAEREKLNPSPPYDKWGIRRRSWEESEKNNPPDGTIGSPDQDKKSGGSSNT